MNGRARVAAPSLAVLWTLLGPAYSRADDLQEPPRPGLVKRAVRSFLSDEEAGAGRGLHVGPFFPRIEIVTSGAGLAPMVHFWAPDIGGTHLAREPVCRFSLSGTARPRPELQPLDGNCRGTRVASRGPGVSRLEHGEGG